MKLKEFIELFDMEILQDGTSHITSTVDSYRITKRKLIIAWLNQTLNRLAAINNTIWIKTIKITPLDNTNKLIIPKMIAAYSINEDTDTPKKIYDYPSKDNYVEYYLENNYTIIKNYYTFDTSIPVYIYGAFYPQQVIDDDECEIDIKDEYIRLLMVCILLLHKNKENTDSAITYYEYKSLLKHFENSGFTARINSVWNSAAHI